LNCGALAIGREWSEFIIVLVVVLIEKRGYEVPVVGNGFEEGVRAGLAVAGKHQVAKTGQDAGLAGRDEAVGEGDGEFGEDAVDFCVGDGGAGGGSEFAGEIGGAKAAARGVGMRVAEAIVLRMSREGTTAFIGKLKPATRV
jgi:hypothetical protein